MQADPVLIIAGLDSGGGAGLMRDLATLAAFGQRAKTAATAITAQTDAQVLAIHPVPAETVAAQIRAAGRVAAVKIGMLTNAAVTETVTRHLPDAPAVLDPVLISSSGTPLLAPDALPALYALMARVTLITPNLPEAAHLTGLPPDAPAEATAAALFAMGARAVLLKGGHAEGPEALDLLFTATARIPLSAPRSATGKRGTGCTLASAIACGLAQGLPLPAACATAKAHVTAYLNTP